MKTTLIVTTLIVSLMMAYASHEAESASTAPGAWRAQAPNAVIELPEDGAVGDRYLVPALPADVMDLLPASEAAGDHYLPQRTELSELVVGERILAAEDLATAYAQDLPGFADVRVADGFRQDTDGTWYYDRFASWMRFPLNR